MKKIFFILSLIILGCAIYLNLAYSHFFRVIGEKSLQNPTQHIVTFIRPSYSSAELITYVAIGDSLTAGVGGKKSTDSYPYQLGVFLAKQKNKPIRVVNLAAPAATTETVMTFQLPRLSEFKPQIVSVLIGTNDMHNHIPLPVFETHMRKILTIAAHTGAKVYVFTIPYLGDTGLALPPYRSYFDWQIRRYNTIVRLVAKESNTALIDLYTLTRKSEQEDWYYSPDLFHPSADAYRLWSTILYDYFDL